MTDARFGASLDLRFDETVEEFAEFLAGLDLSHLEVRWGYLDTHPDAPDAARLREVASAHDLTLSVHAPHVDANLGNLNEPLREGAVRAVTESLDFAAAADADAVVVHGGTVKEYYPDRAHRRARTQAVESLRECARHAAAVGVPLCLENQRDKPTKRRHTATPDRLSSLLDDAGVDSEYFGLTLDVGHAKATGVDYAEFVDRFGDRIHVAHLHDNDGTGDDHDPIPEYESVAAAVGAPYNVFEMKSLADVERCVGARE